MSTKGWEVGLYCFVKKSVVILSEFWNSVRAWRALRYNVEYASKLAKKLAKKQAQQKASSPIKTAPTTNPFSVESKSILCEMCAVTYPTARFRQNLLLVLLDWVITYLDSQLPQSLIPQLKTSQGKRVIRKALHLNLLHIH